MNLPPFTMSKYISELDLHKDAHAYYKTENVTLLANAETNRKREKLVYDLGTEEIATLHARIAAQQRRVGFAQDCQASDALAQLINIHLGSPWTP